MVPRAFRSHPANRNTAFQAVRPAGFQPAQPGLCRLEACWPHRQDACVPRAPICQIAFTKLSSLFTALLLLAVCASGAEPKVRVSLSSPTVGVGESVDYELTIEGAEAPRNPPALSVDGLEVRGTSQSSQLSIVNFDVTRRVTITYTLVPKREGKFTIPEMEVQVDGRLLKTQPVMLTVTPGESANEAGDFAFAKIWIDKKSLYIGEVAAVEVRLYVDANSITEVRSMPTLNGDGFTTQQFGQPVKRRVQLAGKTYALASFLTVITPGKAGKLNVGPVPMNLLFSLPGRNRQRVDILGRSLEPAQEMIVTAPALEIDVKPLPVEGRPKDFSGAIGKFEFEATGTPDRVKIGEPVSMKLTIKGHGNFDRIGQPPLADPEGWTPYTAKQQFTGGENGTTVGVKTFELPVTPTARKSTMPVFAFSFFDSEAGRYVTLKNAASPLTVEGEPVPVAVAPTPKIENPSEPPKSEPKAPPVQDILANLPDLGAASAGFDPRTLPAIFFGVMFAPLPLILALMAWRARKLDGNAARLAALRKERTALMARVKNASERAEVLDAAVKALQIQSTLDSGRNGIEWDIAAILDSRKLDGGGEEAVRELFEARNQLLYAGASRGGDRIRATERDRVLEAVASFEKSPRR